MRRNATQSLTASGLSSKFVNRLRASKLTLNKYLFTKPKHIAAPPVTIMKLAFCQIKIGL